MEISWKLKSKIFRFIDFFKLNNLLYFLQKYISRHAYKKSIKFNPLWDLHKKSLLKYKANQTIFEFGAGKSLIQNLYLKEILKKQILFDIKNMVDYDLIYQSQKFLLKEKGIHFRSKIKTKADLISNKIFYYAPAYASKTNFKSNSVDACISTDTLEHIPKENLIQILFEIKRILRVNGIFSSIIDYSDHYSHTDQNISPLNFLKYSDQHWNKKYNHPSHYQNRLRHYDYRNLLMETGFKIISDKILKKADKIPEINIKYNHKNIDELNALSGYFLAIKI